MADPNASNPNNPTSEDPAAVSSASSGNSQPVGGEASRDDAALVDHRPFFVVVATHRRVQSEGRSHQG